MTSPPWDRAGTLPVPYETRPRAELPALSAGTLPSIAELFTFMRDAELRFGALRMRIEERTATVRGEQLVTMDVALRHPGEARVTTTEPARGTAGNYEVWISDGETVRTYSAPHKLGTQRPVRHTIRGVAGNDDLPGMSRVYWPLTPLPMETLPDLFVHPAGYCQNVLATGRCWIAGTDEVVGREAVLVECDHPRTVEVVADRPDFHISLAVDRETGCILRLIESIGGRVTRNAEAVDFQPDATLPPAVFEFRFPSDTTTIY
jgi:outer membrane lipoprotein-sorting protein